MKLDAALPPTYLGSVPEIARAAETLGFSALWTTETQHDPFLPHTLIAEHTTRLHSGTAVAIGFARSPATLAYTAWDLAQISGGRFLLGLGTQVKAHVERRFGMPWPESVTGQLREQILALRAFWDCWQNGTPLNFRGEHYKLTLMSPFFNPGGIDHPDIPIYIAGVNTGLAKLAGEICQGFHAHPFHTPRYLREVILPAIAQGAEKSGRSRAEVTVSVSIFAATNDGQREFCRQQISFYASTPSYRPVMDLHGWGETAVQLSGLASRGRWGDMPGLINDEMMEQFCVQAGQDDLAAAIQGRYTSLADRVTLYMPFVPGSMDEFWKQLVDDFNALGG
jgi:probable F420-dependent oxidoreductase